MGRAWLTAAVVGLGLVLGACTGGDSPSVTATVHVSATAEVSPTVAASPASSPTPEISPVPSELAVSGLFKDRRPAPSADRRVTVGASPFGAHNGVTATLYDFEAGVAHELGPGTVGAFSTDRETFAWLSVSDAASLSGPFHWGLSVLRLSTFEVTTFDGVYELCREPIGLDLSLYFEGDGTTRATACHPMWISVRDGEELNNAELLALGTPATAPWGIGSSGEPGDPDVRDDRGQLGWHVWRRLTDGDFETTVRFDALFAREVSDGELGVGIPTGAFGEPWNFFVVDITTREATFIATVPWGGRADADADYAAWSTDACGYANGSPAITYVLDRASGEIIELDGGIWPTVHHGLLGDRGSGFRLLVDLDTLETRTLPPREFGRAVWSEDGRYASLGWYPETDDNAVPCEFAIEERPPS